MELLLLHDGHVCDIMSGKEGETAENKKKYEDKRDKGVRNWITI